MFGSRAMLGDKRYVVAGFDRSRGGHARVQYADELRHIASAGLERALALPVVNTRIRSDVGKNSCRIHHQCESLERPGCDGQNSRTSTAWCCHCPPPVNQTASIPENLHYMTPATRSAHLTDVSRCRRVCHLMASSSGCCCQNSAEPAGAQADCMQCVVQFQWMLNACVCFINGDPRTGIDCGRGQPRIPAIRGASCGL